MTKKLNAYFILFAVVLSAWSCKNDLDINAEPKETAVVYGIIDPNSDYQYLRINKTFLVNGNVLDAAKHAALMTFGVELKVNLYTLEKDLKKGGWIKKDLFVFNLDSSFIKNPGLFYTQPNVVFKASTTNPKISYDENTHFLVTVENTKTGYKAEARTIGVQPCTFTRDNPSSFTPLLTPVAYTLNLFNPLSNNYTTIPIAFKPGKNSKIIFPFIRFYWHERQNNQNSEAKYIDYPLPYQRVEKINEGQEIKLSLNSEEFYRFLGERLKKINAKRFADSVSIVVEAGNEDFDTYYAVSQTSSNTTLEKPTFTNVTNGLGVVAAKCTQYTKHKNYYNYPTDLRPFYLDGATNSIFAGGLTASSLRELATGKYTSHLGFAYFKTSQATPIDTVYGP